MYAKQDQLAGLQVLRAVAALMVVLNHALRETNAPDWLTTLGPAGVDIFMVISGFVMIYVTFPDGKPVETPGSFFFKRLSRIAPLYWLVCGFTLTMMAFGFYQHLNPDVFRSLFLLPTEHRISIVSWTLVYEMYFYSLFALALFTRSRLGVFISTTAAIATLLVIGRYFPDATTADYLTRPVALEFVFGMALALIYQHRPGVFRYARHLWIVGFALMAFSQFTLSPYYTQGWARIWGWGLPSILIVASMLPMLHARNRAERAAVALGDASYALYLTHPIVVVAFDWINRHTSAFSGLAWPAIGLALTIISVGVGVATYHIVELPLVRGVRRLGRAAQTQLKTA
ncbi:MAG: acyltransferase [Hyphomonadaceae bacterium]|nr:acyltransferase [Hyphomonadaceae bacterium]